ncbi:hypothetical protein GWN26_00160 [Candidatus Saccharibacteria bacterium]|nr:hypothetical protein [Candidatus Saccharibacteria bacterium]NIW79040.1 hypothetical protein [Calditrichia bacterium]
MTLKKDSIIEQDLVLIHVEEKPALYARVENITADVKPKWWRVKFLMLTFPPKLVTWIIDDEQIRGADFTMGGTPIRIEKVVVPEEEATPSEKDESSDSDTSQKTDTKRARILSLDKKEKDPKK